MGALAIAPLKRSGDLGYRHYFSSNGSSTDWQDLISELYIPLDFVPLCSGPFRAEIRRRRIGCLELSRFATDAEAIHRRAHHVSKLQQPFFMLELPCSGTSTYRQLGRECELSPGSFTLVDTTEPYSFVHAQEQSSYCLKIPAPSLSARVFDPQALCSRSIPIRPGISQMAVDLIVSSFNEGTALCGMSETYVEAHLLETVALVLNVSTDRAPVAGTSVRRAVRRRAMTFIRENLDRPDLNPDRIAKSLGVSMRYLHRVFEDGEDTVASALMDARLTRAHNDLLNPQLLPLSIKEIAFRSGFKSQSHFASAFRAKFEITPSEIRHEARREDR